MNIDGLGSVIYNKAEKVKRFPGMRQPAIMPPEKSNAGQEYKNKFLKAIYFSIFLHFLFGAFWLLSLGIGYIF